MSVTPDQIVAEARRWLGTPFRHQGKNLGRGVDCAGLVICVARALGLGDHNEPYDRKPDPEKMFQTLRENLQEISPRGGFRAGDILYMRYGRHPTHLGIVTGPNTMIHAFQQVGAVCEHRLDVKWRSRVVARFRYRGVTD